MVARRNARYIWWYHFHFKKLNIMKSSTHIWFATVLILLTPLLVDAQSTQTKQGDSPQATTLSGDVTMPAYVIERTIPGAGQLTSEQLQEISRVSCNVINDLGSGIQWLHSYVTADKVFCVYRTNDQELLRKHAEAGGFPIDAISPVSTVISPATAKGKE